MSDATMKAEKTQDAPESKDLATDVSGEDAEQVKGGRINRRGTEMP